MPRTMSILVVLLSLFSLTGCDEPAEFGEPLGPAAYDAWDPRIEGNWVALIDEEGVGVGGPDNAVPMIASLTVRRAAAAEAEGAATLFGGRHRLVDGAFRAEAYFATLTYQAFPVRIGEEVFFNVRILRRASLGSVDIFGEAKEDFELSDEVLPDGVYMVARLRILESGNLEIGLIFESDLRERFGTKVEQENGPGWYRWDAPRRMLDCGEDCSYEVYGVPPGEIAKMIEDLGDGAFTGVIEFARSPASFPPDAMK